MSNAVPHCSQCGEPVEQIDGTWLHVVDEDNPDPLHCVVAYEGTRAVEWTDDKAEPCIKAGCGEDSALRGFVEGVAAMEPDSKLMAWVIARAKEVLGK